ncbi:MAG: hypothetical protein II410_00385, partial [Ruminococcus sp.]|nr:hypothetical protein [Ruminococcus sp.]
SLAFAAEDSPLFTLYADGNHSILGTVIGEENTVISAEFAELDPNDVTKSAMQEDINVIILHLTEDYNFEVGTAVEPEAETVTGSGADRETFEIPFAGLVLRYPKEWQDQVTVAEQEDGSLAFAAEDSPLFTLYADGNHSILGTVISETNTILSVEFAQIDQNDTTRMAMQKDINVIIHHLSMDYDFEIGAAVEDEDDSTFQIETSVTTLYYPAKWQDRITVNVTDEKVSFSAGETPLFDLVFTKCDGYLLGTYGSTPIYIMEYPVTEQEHAAMQMGVNVILEHLQEDDQFIMN